MSQGITCAFVVAGLALVLVGSAHAQLVNDESAFQIGRRFPLIGYPTTLTAADLDDDGLPDLIVAESMPNRIAIWWNDGSGGLEPTPTVIADLPAFAAVAIDANGDGTPDVVWTDSLGLHRALIRPGRRVGPAELIVGGTDLGPLAVGDLDRDGHDDLVLGRGSNVEWMRGGLGGLTAPVVLESTATNVTVLAIGAVDQRDKRESGAEHRGRDNRRAGTEIAVAYEWSYDGPPPAVDVLHIDRGVVTGTTEVPPPQDFGPVWSMVLADLDQDGALDLVIGGEAGAVVMWGDDFGVRSAFPALDFGTLSLAVGDLDHDGRLDLVTADQGYDAPFDSEPTLQVFYGLGGRRLAPNGQYVLDPESYNGIECPGMTLADMDGDGTPDIVSLESQGRYAPSSFICVARHGAGRGVGLERVDQVLDMPYYTWDGGMRVIHRPGREGDELMASKETGAEIFHMDEEGRLVSESVPDLHGPLLFADVDGDGRDDAIEIRDSVAVVHFATRSNTYAAAETVAVPRLNCAAHLDRDRPVALVGVRDNGDIVLARRQADGHYAYQEIPYPLALPSDPFYVHVAAIPESHGRPDRLIVCGSVNLTPSGPHLDLRIAFAVLRLGPDEAWEVVQRFRTGPHPVPGPGIWPASPPFFIADVNADREPDVLVMEANGDGGSAFAFLSVPGDSLDPIGKYIDGLTEEPVFQVADANDDGHPDVLIGAALGGNVPWLTMALNEGNGVDYRTLTLLLGCGAYARTRGVAVADMDGDGNPDVVAITDEGQVATIFGADHKQAPPRRHPSRVPLIAPATTPLAIAAVSPMPARDAFDVRFTAPGPEPARLELLDVAGRRVSERVVDGAGPAHFAIGTEARSGVYWLRLTQGVQSATARVVVLR